ncbi:MAG TPA: tyrosine--tRNA ligase [Candidatus Omnitrophota bacterium]|nr:tyrosine--tRNA ligase [Candidatus Omnitrophota bacterium]
MDMDQQIAGIARGTTEIINLDLLKSKLSRAAETGRPLTVKAGFDPTAPDIHLGHVVLLRKLRQFQDLGHRVCFLIGDFTAQIGDPSGRDQLRPKMSPEVVAKNAQTYKQQVLKILDPQKTEVVFNSTWLATLTAQQVLELSAHSTVAQMLARADFKKRFEEQKEISILELFYPLLQGYDSVVLKADIECGGSDQTFNLLMGRQLQEAYGQEPQVVLMTPLLEGTDGEKKMSKSLHNYIGIDEPPDEIMGKIMSISDDLMMRYYEILTTEDLVAIRAMHPKEAKLKLGEIIVGMFYDEREAREAGVRFQKVFGQKQVPDDMPEYVLSSGNVELIADILLGAGLAPSKKEVRRLLAQGAVTWNGEKIQDENWAPQPGVLKVGKRRFLRIAP